MSRLSVLIVGAVLGACSHEGASRPETIGTLPAGTSPRFAGEIALVGELSAARDGVVFITVSRIAAGAPVMMSRRLEVGDPVWNEGRGQRSTYFTLAARDLEPAQKLALDAEMELSVRFDPDGDLRTDDPGFVFERRRVRTGDTSLQFTLGRPTPAPDAPRAAHADQGG